MKPKTDTLRIMRTAAMDLKASAKTVFPLLCPVKEVDWIAGWENICTLIYTDSGIAEEACVFETDTPDEGKSLWICSHYDAENKNITYIKHVIGKAVIKWDMCVRDTPNGSTIDMVYNATSLSNDGIEFVRKLDQSGFEMLYKGIQRKINTYVTKA